MQTSMRATTLTLSTNPGGLRWLADCPRLAGPTVSGPLVRQSRTICFDTPDLRLFRRGVELQVRQEGNRFVQRLSFADAAADDAAHVWEADVPDATPALDRLPAGGIGPALVSIPGGDLAPVMAWRVDRQTRVLQESGVDGGIEIVEIAFDEGEIEIAGVTIPIAEIALSVLRGPADATYRLALDLQKLVPLGIEPRNRFVRGLQRSAGIPPRWQKMSRSACAAGDTIDDALFELFKAGFTHFLANESAAIDGRDPEGVHQVRVALRRMRSAWSAFKPLLDDGAVAPLRADAKWLADNLGPARDWDVFLTEQLSGLDTRHPGSAALATLRQHAEAARAAAYHQAHAALLSQRTTRFVLALGAWIEGRGWRSTEFRADGRDDVTESLNAPLGAFATAVLARQYRKIRKRGRGFAALPAEARHELRIAVKKLRYSAEFFVLQYGNAGSARRFVAAAARLQDALGGMNDVAMLGSRLDGLQADAPNDTILARGLGMAIGAAGATAAATGEAAVRDAWRRFRQQPEFWARPAR